jgi:hypothetical protein
VKITLRHIFDIDLEGFWKMFFEPEYARRLHEEGLGFKKCTEVELVREPSGAIQRKIRVDPKFDMPAPVAKILGERFYYLESGRFDPSQKRYRYTLTPSVLSDKVTISGVIWAEPRGPSSVERIVEIEAHVKVFGLGSVLEGFIEKENRAGFQRAATFSNAYLREQ